MKALLLLTPIVLTLVACGDGSKIKDAVRQNLKDPGSAKFNDTIISSDAKRACIVWNAKNSMGGYGDWDVAELKNIDSKWIIIKMKGNSENCSENAFKALDAGENVTFDATSHAINILEKAKNISHSEAIASGINGECRRLVDDYTYHSKNVAEYKVRQDLSKINYYENQLEKYRKKLESGNCD
jgi:hypothetical protein